MIELVTFLVIVQDLEDSGHDHLVDHDPVHLEDVLAQIEDHILDLQVDPNPALLVDHDPAASHLMLADGTPAAGQCQEKSVAEAPNEREIVVVVEVLMTNPGARNLKEDDVIVQDQTAVAVMIEAPRRASENVTDQIVEVLVAKEIARSQNARGIAPEVEALVVNVLAPSPDHESREIALIVVTVTAATVPDVQALLDQNIVSVIEAIVVHVVVVIEVIVPNNVAKEVNDEVTVTAAEAAIKEMEVLMLVMISAKDRLVEAQVRRKKDHQEVKKNAKVANHEVEAHQQPQ